MKQGSDESSNPSSPIGKRAVREARHNGNSFSSENGEGGTREALVMNSGDSGKVGQQLDFVNNIVYLINKLQSMCGNGIIEENEDCDRGNLGTSTCQSLHKTP